MRAPANLTAVFLAVAAVAVSALVWVGAGIVRRDRALEIQRLNERRDAAADRLVASLERAVASDERLLAGNGPPGSVPEDGAILVVADHAVLRAWPERSLLYSPVAASLPEAPADVFRAAERLEYADRDSGRAVTLLLRLAESRDPAVKAGAHLRLARNLRKAGRAEEALDVYHDLSAVTVAGLSGTPADLVAYSARCALLEELGRTDRLRREAQALAEGLRNGRWQLDRATWHYHAGKAQRWLGRPVEVDPDRQAVADGVDWVWRRWKAGPLVDSGSSGRRVLGPDPAPVVILWRASNERLAALVVGTRCQGRSWFEPALAALDRPGIGIAILDDKDRVLHGSAPLAEQPQTRRLAAATGLPWTVVAASADVEGELRAFTQRRQLMVMGLGALSLLIVAASYLIGRAVSRELAVARLQSDFVSAVSHEFRTPLTALAQFTEILGEHEDAPIEKRRTFHEAQARATRRLTRLVESLLDFGRMEAGARPYRLEPIDAAEVTEDVVRDFRPDVEPAGFTVSYKGPADHAVVNADREALTQAVWSLLDNAVKYSGESRVVRVEVEQGSDVMIRVRDEGFGIPAPELKRIFRKFARGSAAIEHDVKGTGIGLAMVKHIVDAHAGRVIVDSEPGRGSTFTIVLPAGG
jgi:signal transduction histidine kinase